MEKKVYFGQLSRWSKSAKILPLVQAHIHCQRVSHVKLKLIGEMQSAKFFVSEPLKN